MGTAIGLSEDFSAPLPGASHGRVEWVRVALSNLFDVEFLQRHSRHGGLEAHFANGAAAQDALLGAIKQLKPRDEVPLRSAAWRTFNVLQLRYVKGLSQSETAVQLNLGVRQLRREQAKAIRTIVALLFQDQPAASLGGQTAPLTGTLFASQPELVAHELVRPEELLQAVLYLLDSIVQKRDLHVEVSVHPPLPALRCNPMIARQLFVSAVEWMLRQMTRSTLGVDVSAGAEGLSLALRGPADNSECQDHTAGLTTIRDLAQMAGGSARADTTPPFVTLHVSLPASGAAVCAGRGRQR